MQKSQHQLVSPIWPKRVAQLVVARLVCRPADWWPYSICRHFIHSRRFVNRLDVCALCMQDLQLCVSSAVNVDVASRPFRMHIRRIYALLPLRTDYTSIISYTVLLPSPNEGGSVFTSFLFLSVCLSFCLSVNKITQKVADRFSLNFMGRWDMALTRID